MTISRRGLFGFLASLPVAAPAVLCAPKREPDYRLTASEVKARMIDPPMIAAEDMPPSLDRRIRQIEEKYLRRDEFNYWRET